MTDYNALSELLFPDVDKDTDYYEKKYPPRNLKEGARVTRFAPSPTGFLHLGNLFTCTVAYKTARASGGIFYVRVEDTDSKRKVDGAVEVMLQGLKEYGITADEGVMADGSQKGDYGPYIQSMRKDIYRAYAKSLVRKGLAYPCFCSAEDLDELRRSQENEDIKGYYGKYAKCRNLPYDEVKKKIDAGMPWTLRLRSPGDITKKCFFDDMIKGKIEMPENVLDVVLLKADGIPTYHFAHVIDDHLMHTTHVIRGDEWIASTSLHLQLFKVLGIKPVKYAHVAPLMKEENGNKRKLSKRKDPELAVTYYDEQGFPPESVNEYMMTIMNSNYEDWRRANKDADISDFPFNLKKMSVSGALFDLVKLTDVSKNIICKMTAEEVFAKSYAWAEKYDPELASLYDRDREYATAVLNIDRGNKKPRKDIAKWSDIHSYISYMYDETFEKNYDLCGNATPKLAVKVLELYRDIVDINDDKDAWFEKIRQLCPAVDCAANVKDYKKDPDRYKGHVGDVSTVIRVALTGRTNTPDLFSITALLGAERIRKRFDEAIAHYKEEK